MFVADLYFSMGQICRVEWKVASYAFSVRVFHLPFRASGRDQKPLVVKSNGILASVTLADGIFIREPPEILIFP